MLAYPKPLPLRIVNLQQAQAFLQHRFIFAEEEYLNVVYLSESGTVLGSEILAGGIDHVQLSLRAIFWRAMEADAGKLLIAHNHPSGVAEPSAGDRDVTKRLASVGKHLNVNLMDHLIYGGGRWFSFRMAGLL